MSTKISIISLVLAIGLTPCVFAGGAKNHNATFTPMIPCPGYDGDNINDGLVCHGVSGFSQGNHELDCTIIVPESAGENNLLPLIVWANGWEQGNVLGQFTTNGYLKGLKEWAKSYDGGYIIAAANQWSVQESDVLACAQWVTDNAVGEGGADIPVNIDKVGLAGHSQGGGAVIKAGDGKGDLDITAVLAMNPYGPAWVKPARQNGPVLLLGGSTDTTTPPESYQSVWDAIKAQANPGGINAVLEGGTHNSEAWNGVTGSTGTFSVEDAAKGNFGAFQEIGLLWWQIQLKDAPAMVEEMLKMKLDNEPWNSIEYPTEYANFPSQ